ncbi:MAG: hypothetical protein SGBAC_001044 [Bacillariaceae sp.]
MSSPASSPADSKSAVQKSDSIISEQATRLEEECQQLLSDIKRIGVEGEPSVLFGDLFDDDLVQNYYEALIGTLKAAKKRKLIDFKGQMLLKGAHDKVKITILNA